jgi:hypothetical protein
MTTPFNSQTYDYTSNLVGVVGGDSGLYYSILRHHPSEQYTVFELIHYLSHPNFVDQHGGNVAFNILPGDGEGGPAGSVMAGLSSHFTASIPSGAYQYPDNPEHAATGHTPRPLTEVLNTALDGSNFLFKHLIYFVLNTIEVQTDYEANSNKPTWIFFLSEPYRNFGYIWISPDQQTIVIEPGWRATVLWGDLNSYPDSFNQNEVTLNDPNGSNIFYLVMGWTGRAHADAALAASFTLPTTGGAPYSSSSSTGGSSDPVVTATGAACSIVPKNFNLF